MGVIKKVDPVFLLKALPVRSVVFHEEPSSPARSELHPPVRVRFSPLTIAWEGPEQIEIRPMTACPRSMSEGGKA